MDVASTTAWGLQLSVNLIIKLRKAYKDAKDLPQALETHEKKLASLLAIISAIDEEEALKTATVTLQLKAISEVVSKIKICLKTLSDETDKGGVSKVWHQLAHGKKDEKTLAGLMKDLDEAKSNLGLILSVANIGLVKSHEDSHILLADPRLVKHVDRVLVRVLGEGKGLQLWKLIEGRQPQGDGRIAVNKVEIATLYDGLTSDGVPHIEGDSQSDPGRVERVIIANTARENSKMINAPLGEDMWANIDVKIIGNETSGNALMVNFPTTMENVTQFMAKQAETAAADRTERATRLDYEERRHVREIAERKDIREFEDRKETRAQKSG